MPRPLRGFRPQKLRVYSQRMHDILGWSFHFAINRLRWKFSGTVLVCPPGVCAFPGGGNYPYRRDEIEVTRITNRRREDAVCWCKDQVVFRPSRGFLGHGCILLCYLIHLIDCRVDLKKGCGLLVGSGRDGIKLTLATFPNH